MKEDESMTIARASRALGVVLDMDLSGDCQEVRLESNTRAHLDLAKRGLDELLQGPLDKANKRKALAESHLRVAGELFFDDGELFGADGEPTEAAENGRRPETVRTFEEPELPGMDGTNGKIDWRLPGTSSVRVDIHRGLVQALQDGSGKTQACKLVAEAAGADLDLVKDGFETLVKLGVIHKNGKGWVAELPEDHLAETSADANGVCATSETPEPVGF